VPIAQDPRWGYPKDLMANSQNSMGKRGLRFVLSTVLFHRPDDDKHSESDFPPDQQHVARQWGGARHGISIGSGEILDICR